MLRGPQLKEIKKRTKIGCRKENGLSEDEFHKRLIRNISKTQLHVLRSF